MGHFDREVVRVKAKVSIMLLNFNLLLLNLAQSSQAYNVYEAKHI